MKRSLGWFAWIAPAALSIAFVGCEWQGQGDTGGWEDSYNWVNFNGVYRGENASAIVRKFSGEQVTTSTGQQIEFEHDVQIGAGSGVPSTEYDGAFAPFVPVFPGSVTIVAGGFQLNDVGSNTLSGSGASGTINYDTGKWTIDLGAAILGSGVPIVGSWAYIVGGSGGTGGSGGENTIKTLNVQQEGNLLTFIDSEGNRYNGKMGTVSTTSGNLLAVQTGVIVAQFSVTGARNGNHVEITGIFQGTLGSTGTSGTGGAAAGNNVLFDRQIQATWLEGDLTGDVVGFAGSIQVFLPTPAYDARATAASNFTGTVP